MNLGERLRGEDLSPINLDSIQNEVSIILKDLMSVDPACEVIVFGSFAKGLANRSSDLDIAVLLPDQINKREFKKKFYATRKRIHLPVDFIFRNRSEHLQKINSSTVDQDIFEYGIKIYGGEQK